MVLGLAAAAGLAAWQRDPLQIALAATPWGREWTQPGGMRYRWDLRYPRAVRLEGEQASFPGVPFDLAQVPTRLDADARTLYVIRGGQLVRCELPAGSLPPILDPAPTQGSWQALSDLAASPSGLWLLSSSGDLFWRPHGGTETLVVAASPGKVAPDPLVLTLGLKAAGPSCVDLAQGALLEPLEGRWKDVTPVAPPRAFDGPYGRALPWRPLTRRSIC